MKIDVTHIAKLANITLTTTEEKKFETQLSAVLEHIEKMSKVSIENVEATDHVTGLTTIERADETSPSLSQVDATKNSPTVYNGLFVVPVILQEAIEQ